MVLGSSPRRPTNSSLRTHWFKSSCQQFGPYGDYFYFNISRTANYYNWDFGLDNLITTANHLVAITLDQGYLTTGWGYGDNGEGSILIYGSFTQGGSNTCLYP